ncbi:MAG: putative porin [Acidobacteriota bacterium]|nr:putative porin [Acidobacteriota bacterium]
MNVNLRILILSIFLLCFASITALAQTVASNRENIESSAANKTTTAEVPSEMEEIKRQLREQQKQIEQLHSMLSQQSQIIERLQNNAPQTNQNPTITTQTANSSTPLPTDTIETRLSKVEEQSKKTTEAVSKNQLGTMTFSGDLRMQYDSLYGLLNNAANVNNPTILGNELSSRQRIRYRLRFAARGKIGDDVFTGNYLTNGEKRTDKEFEWGIRLVGGTLSNPASPNPVLTDFFSRKPIGIDQVYVSWRPRPIPGLRIIAGKFETPWTHTEMTFDNDVQVEGVGEIYSRDIKNSFLKNITFSAWQLPLLERGTTFVRNANGTINIEESERGGRDLGLFGAQLQGRFALDSKTNLTLSAANLHYANTSAINPIQVFGNNLQLPVTITIPATTTTPAQTISTVVNIPREFLVSGNGNLGLSAATNNTVNRDGRLASGYNLVDLMAQFEFKQFKYNPMTLVLNYVRNTQTRDVIVAGVGGANVFLPNNENDGVWTEFRFQSLRKTRGSDFNAAVRGDILFSYTFLRIEKDAVLTPFNWDDLIQGSDISGHRVFIGYTVDPRVTFNFTGLFNQRPNGLLGPFGTNPAGSLNRYTNRLQVDTVFRF